jgi:hypothetical protein
MRLVFVADVIPPTLRAIVEFLNEQMTDCEVIAIEIKQYLDPDSYIQTKSSFSLQTTWNAIPRRQRRRKRARTETTSPRRTRGRTLGDGAVAVRSVDFTRELGGAQPGPCVAKAATHRCAWRHLPQPLRSY